MEDRHHLKPTRTGHSVVQDVPTPKHDHHHRKALLVVGVTMSMVVLLALYAASYRYRELAPSDSGDLQRWGVIKDEFMDDSESLVEGFKDISSTVTGVLNARKVRAESIDLMKERLVGSASATDPGESASSTSPEDTTP